MNPNEIPKTGDGGIEKSSEISENRDRPVDLAYEQIFDVPRSDAFSKPDLMEANLATIDSIWNSVPTSEHYAFALKIIDAMIKNHRRDVPDSVVDSIFNHLKGSELEAITWKILNDGDPGWGDCDIVGRNIYVFPILDPKIAFKLIDGGVGYRIIDNLDRWQNVDQEIAFRLIPCVKDGYEAFKIVKNIDHFAASHRENIFVKLLESSWGKPMVEEIFHSDSFKNLDNDMLCQLIGHGYNSEVLEKIHDFQDLNAKVFAGLILTGSATVDFCLSNFQDIDQGDIARHLIESGGSDIVIEHLYDFGDLDEGIAKMLIQQGKASTVLFNKHRFKDFDFDDGLALQLIETGQKNLIVEYFDSFEGEFFEKAKSSCRDVMLEPVEYFFVYFEKDSQNTEATIASLEALPPEQRYRSIAERLIKAKVWDDESNIISPFRLGAEVFGYEKMFRYLNREDFSRHDGLHAFRSILDLYDSSMLSANDFYANVLDQVARDGGNYDSGTAHHEFNEIALSFDHRFTENLEKAKKFPSIPNLQDLANSFSSPAEIFESWKNVRRYNELVKLLGQTELLENLEKEPNQKLRDYVTRLAFHPDGNVDMQKVFEFWRDPKNFLDLPDVHTPAEVHNRKKPSNLADIPNLDLTPEDLRDALVEGSLDRIQAFVPMAVAYEIGYSLREETRKAIGSFKEKIPGLSRDPKKLFGEVANILKPSKITVQQFLAGEPIPAATEEQIKILLIRPDVGIPEPTRNKFPAYRVVMRTNAKSDPQGVLAGNDTACCMPFGSGKNNVYTWNPACTLATLEIERPDGSRRTIAQSVLTKDRDIGKNVAEVVAQLRESGETHLQDIFSEEILHASPAVLACDNIEVAPNYKSEDYQTLIKTVYQDFFREYLERYGKAQGFSEERVVVGLGYSDALTDMPQIENKTVPEAPVGYSDKMHQTCYELSMKPDLKQKLGVLKKTVNAPQEIFTVDKKEGGRRTLPLTFEDTMATAYIEGKAYAGNQSLMEYMWKIENVLIAKDISNAHKNRPNMSFKYETDGKMRGYLVAYEGKLGINEEQSEEEGVGEVTAKGVSVIYIADLAVAEPGTLGGGRAGASLVGSFVEQYAKEYLRKGNAIPISAYAREQTSYKLILKELKRYEKELGVEFELEEGESYQAGADTMHPILIRVKK